MELCPNKEVCGSCSWSHIPYDKQLDQKLSDINGSFKLKELDLCCTEILPSPKTSHYRNRMDFVIDFEGRVGMRMKGKWWKVIDNHTCFISDEKIEALFKIVRDWSKKSGLSYFDRKAHTGFLRYAVIRTSSTGQTMLNIVTSDPADEDVTAALDKLKGVATTLIWSINHTISDVSFGDELRVLDGPGYIEEQIGSTKYRISPNAFFQTNSHASHLLIEAVEEFTGDLSEKILLDLYCGTGFFSVALAKKAKKTIGVELIEEAIADARENARINGLLCHLEPVERSPNTEISPLAPLGRNDTGYSVEFHSAKTEDFDWGQYHADVVILDPPRSGMHDRALEDVLRIQPKEIVYVSCNPKNFAREMVRLKEFYRVDHMRAIDMFPHTPHVELVSKLVKK